MAKWISVWVICVAALVLTGTMLQSMNVVDFRELTLQSLEAVPAFQDSVRTYRVGLNAEEIVDEQRRQVELMELQMEKLREEVEAEQRRLNEYEEQLQRRESELLQRSRQLEARAESLEAQARNLQDLERLQYIYSTMRPRDLAPILDELEDPVVAVLLGGMGDRQVAAVLAEIEPTRAAKLSKMVGGISAK